MSNISDVGGVGSIAGGSTAALAILKGAPAVKNRNMMALEGGNMSIPILGIAQNLATGNILGAVGTALGAVAGGKKRSHRRKRRLTNSDMVELTQIKNTLGRTAAAEALPFYLRRG